MSELPAHMRPDRSFQGLILTLQRFWADYGCVILQPYDMEMGAGTFHPASTLRALGPRPWNAAYVQPSRRPKDGRYGENPNRLQHYYQYQVILKPSPPDLQAIYLDSLAAIGLDGAVHDIRFVEDDWESPTLGAWGLGWECWCDGMEVSQFTYFQQVAGYECAPVSGELTYGLERLACYLQGVDRIMEVSPGNLFGTRWYPTFDIFGTLPLILGSAYVTIAAIVIALPLGVTTAVFVREVAPNWAREILKPLIEVLAGIPSVVLGFFGMHVIAPLVRTTLNVPTGLSAFTGAVLLAYMSLPTIISVAEDALDSVPRSYRDAALAMGATNWQTIWRVVVPAARSGIAMAVMLGMGRAIGETMAVMMVTGNAARMPLSPGSIFMPVRTMTATVAAEMGEVANGSVHYHALFGIGIILFILTFIINILAAGAIFKKRNRGGLR